jgi:hypothetical protein
MPWDEDHGEDYVGGVEDLEKLLLQKARQDKTGIAGNKNISPEKFQELIELALSQSERGTMTDPETGRSYQRSGSSDAEMLKNASPDRLEVLRTALLHAITGNEGEEFKALFAPRLAAEQDLVTKDIAPDTNRWRIRGGRKSGSRIDMENFLKELGFE